MSSRNLALVLLCLVDAIAGSSRFQDWDHYGRHLRHASCPACRRERPDALVSWDTQPRREYEFDGENGPWWQFGSQPSSSSFRSNPYGNPYSGQYNAYERAVRSRGASAVGRAGGAGGRESPFTIGRDLDFDVAPAQASVVRGLAAPPPPPLQASPPYQPNFPYARASRRTQYGKPSGFYEEEAARPFSNRFADFGLADNEPGGFDEARRWSSGNTRTIFRGDRYLADSFEEGNPMMEPEQTPRQPFPYGTSATGVRMQEAGQSPQRRDQLEERRVVYRPEARRRTYDRPWSPDLGLFRMTQNVARQVSEIVNDSRRQNQSEDRRREAEVAPKNEETEMAEEINVSEMGNGERAEDVKEKRDVKNDDGSGETLPPATTERPLVIMTIPPLVMP